MAFLCFSNKVKLSGFLSRRKFREENKKSGRRKSAEWAPTILLQIRGGGEIFFTQKDVTARVRVKQSFLYTKLQAKQVLDGKVEKSQTLFFFKPDKNKKVKSRIRLTRFEVPKISKFCKT